MNKKRTVWIALFLLITINSQYAQPKSQEKKEILKKIELKKYANTAYNLFRFGKDKSANYYIKKIYKIAPDSVEYYYLQAVYYSKKKRYKDSFDYLNIALLKNPSHDRAHSLAGQNYLKISLWQDAAKSFSRACEADPYNPFYRFNLAVSYFMNQKWEYAIGEAAKAIELKKNYKEAMALLVYCLYELNNKKDAYRYYRQYKIEIEKINWLKEIVIAYHYNILKDYKFIIDQLKNKRNLSNDSMRFLARSYWKQGNPKKAYYIYKKLLKKPLVNQKIYFEYLNLLENLNKNREAKKLLYKIPTKEESNHTYILYRIFQKEARKIYREIHWEFRN